METSNQNHDLTSDMLSFNSCQNILSHSLRINHPWVRSMVQLSCYQIPGQSWLQRVLEFLRFRKLVSFRQKCRRYRISRINGKTFFILVNIRIYLHFTPQTCNSSRYQKHLCLFSPSFCLFFLNCCISFDDRSY